ncbi:MAG: DUF1622 domain-containing protein [Candidatus Bipolaricaulia bacterium]
MATIFGGKIRISSIVRFPALVLLLALLVYTPQSVSASEDDSSYDSVFDRVANRVATGIEAAGIAIIIGGAIAVTGVFFRQLLRERALGEPYHQYRANLGRVILLSLEFLVAADIVGTVAVDPTFQNLGVLGLIVLIRTALSFALEVEISGHWPWKQSEGSRKSKGEEAA